ncbi:hypothetical protein QC761_508850 [Podospora bellae-mahoneyi]|uniref:RecQ mediated genome instability protein 1 OB-fold domain-containing protein n=1 Tax=Podospora bellae-mahoneyi TaxID=2093777 RepID=A0ABR0FF71_9PEZI|nr:hypothetical protein QC761_508850 [Podospora bellae-mahoneyi]
MAPEPGRSRNNRRFYPYGSSYVDSPLKFLRRPTDPNVRSLSAADSGSEDQQDDSTLSSLADSVLFESDSNDEASHLDDHSDTEESHELGSSSNPIDLANLLNNSQTPPGKSVAGKTVSRFKVAPQPNFGNQKSKRGGTQSAKAPVAPNVIQPRQRSHSDLISHNPAEPKAAASRNHSNQNHTDSQGTNPTKENKITLRVPPHNHPRTTVTNISPRSAPQQNRTSQPDTLPPMTPQKRPPTQPVPHDRPTQQRRLMAPPPAAPSTIGPSSPPTNVPRPPQNNQMDLSLQLQTALSTTALPFPSLPFLTRLVQSRNPPPPFPSLLATTRARILSSDITTDILDPSYINSHSLPPEISNPLTKSATLSHDVVVQVLDIINISKSKWEQVEELEAKARGEEKRGREVVRLPTARGDGEVDQGTQAGTQFQTQQRGEGKATHRILFQDPKGGKIYGLELVRVEKLGVGKTNIGEKWLLKKGTSVSRGVVMLEPGRCECLGGKVEVWNRAWNEGRLERLRGEATGEGTG